jgi:hypothetical protein
MHQSIEKEREENSGHRGIAAMFYGSSAVWAAFSSFSALETAAPSSSAALTDRSVFAAASAPPRTLDACYLNAFARHRTRRRHMTSNDKFSAGKLMAISAFAASAVNRNKRGTQAAKTETITMTEQRRCLAA